MEEGYNLLMKHIKNHSKILIIVDPDCDGYTSAALFYLYIKRCYAEYKPQLNYIMPIDKKHGLEQHIDIFLEKHICDLIICPDSSSNDYEFHKILKDTGYDILVIDHHESEKYSEDAIVINNQLSGRYSNKALSGVGVVYKFFEYCEMKEQRKNISLEYVDLVALGQISDMMNMNTIENRFICDYGLTHIKNPFFQALIDKQSYSIGDKLTQIGVAFYITPLINALIRVGSELEKERLFLAFIEPDILVPSTKRGEKGLEETICSQSLRNCSNAKSKQNRIKERAAELLDIQILENDLDKNKIIILCNNGLDIPNTMTGLCAMGVVAKYKKPVLLGKINEEGIMKGSIRGREDSELKNFKDFLLNSNYMEYVQGQCGL